MAKPFHHDINLVRGQRFDDEFIYAADLTNVVVEFYLNGVVARSTTAGTLTVTVNKPSLGKSTIMPIFTTDETELMDPSYDYKIKTIDGVGTKEMLFYGKMTLET